MDAQSRPALRPVEFIVVSDREHGRDLVLRDTQGVSERQAVVSAVLVPVVARFDGASTCEEIAAGAAEELGRPLPVEVVVQLADELDQGLYLEGTRFEEARARVVQDFASSAVRPASHAGAAYHGERIALARYIDEACLARAGTRAGADVRRPSMNASCGDGPPMVALIAPHIDPWRGAVGYGRAYSALAASLPPEADTFLLFGTSHAPMREPFALCRKTFATPLGEVEADVEGIDALAASAVGFDPYADQFNHKREHSLEFQVVFLKHLMKSRPFRIVPVLAGLAAQQLSGQSPDLDERVTRFMSGVRRLVELRAGRVVVVAGADLAHVGPRFGDGQRYDARQRSALARADRASLECAEAVDPGGFWSHVAADLDVRRVCGLAPIWSLLQSIASLETEGRLLHYEQTIDDADGSIVSHGAVGFYAVA